MRPNPQRRLLIKACLAGGLMSTVGWHSSCFAAPQSARLIPVPGNEEVLLPEGFAVRVVARSGHTPAGNGYRWHAAPDGGATIATADGGWIYVSNSELPHRQGGVGALRFSARGDIVDAYSILTGTSRNCSGGMMPWGRYLSAEETGRGRIWECDPFGMAAARPLPALGVFAHEAVALDPVKQQLYLTEDHPRGRLYRFTPAHLTARGFADLTEGRLDVARVIRHHNKAAIDWLPVPDPSAKHTPTRKQVKESSAFAGAEGIVYHDATIYFATKGDDRIWRYTLRGQLLDVFYDPGRISRPVLSGVDNLLIGRHGNVYVAEDGGDMQIVMLDRQGRPLPVVQLIGHDQSEMTGIAFSPDYRHLYFSSQRGKKGHAADGVTYEVTGVFA